MEAAPSKALDTELTSNEISIAMGLLLGVDAYEESSICKYCGAVQRSTRVHHADSAQHHSVHFITHQSFAFY